MQRLSLQMRLLPLTILAVCALAAVPVSAHNGVNDGHNNDTLAAVGDEERQKAQKALREKPATSTRLAEAAMDDQPSADDAREKGRKLIAKERVSKTSKTVEQRQKSCEARQANITKKLENYSVHAEKHLAVFDKIYERIQTFHDTKKLDAPNYDELIAAADVKQNAATEAVAALQEVAVAIDCTSEDPAAAVATVKTAVADTRTNLKDYRTAIKDVIRALNASPKNAADDSDGGTTTDGDTAGEGETTPDAGTTTPEAGTAPATTSNGGTN